MKDHPTTAASSPHELLELAPIRLAFAPPPRLARRPRTQASAAQRTPSALAATLLARALVPDLRERRRLVRRDLYDALGERGTRTDTTE